MSECCSSSQEPFYRVVPLFGIDSEQALETRASSQREQPAPRADRPGARNGRGVRPRVPMRVLGRPPAKIDCTANRLALAPAIGAAAPGVTLEVLGICAGTFTIDKNLTLSRCCRCNA